MMLKRNYTALILAAIIIAAAGLRLYGLSIQSFWFDELQTVINSNPGISWKEMLGFLNCCDSHPPLFFIFERFSFAWFGYTESAARLVSALAGILSVWAIYVLGKEIKNERVGLFAAVISAVNFFSIYYSQEARGYTLLLLLTTFSHLFFIRMCKYLKVKDAMGYVLFTALLLYTHYFGFLVIFSHLAIAGLLWLRYKDTRKRLFTLLFVSDTLVLLVYFPWLPYLLKINNVTSTWIPVPKPTFFIDYFQDYFGHYNPVTAILLVLLLFYVIQVLIHRKAVRNFKTDPLIFSFIWVAITLLIYYLVPYLRSVLVLPALVERYTIVALPSIIIAVAFGLTLVRFSILRYGILVVFVVLSLHELIDLKKYYIVPCKTQYRELTSFIAAGNKNVPLINEQSAWQQGYYLNREHYSGHIIQARKEDIVDSILEGTSIQYKTDSFWLVGLHTDTHLNHDKQIALNRIYELVVDSNFFNAWAQLYVLKPSANR